MKVACLHAPDAGHGRHAGRLGRPARRWMLLGVVLIGALAMHLISRHHIAGGHDPIVPGAASVVAFPMIADSLSTSSTAGDRPMTDATDGATPTDELVIVGCALLLLLAGAMSATRRRAAVDRLRTTQRVRSGALRGPPLLLSRLVLCVARI